MKFEANYGHRLVLPEYHMSPEKIEFDFKIIDETVPVVPYFGNKYYYNYWSLKSEKITTVSFFPNGTIETNPLK